MVQWVTTPNYEWELTLLALEHNEKMREKELEDVMTWWNADKWYQKEIAGLYQKAERGREKRNNEFMDRFKKWLKERDGKVGLYDDMFIFPRSIGKRTRDEWGFSLWDDLDNWWKMDMDFFRHRGQEREKEMIGCIKRLDCNDYLFSGIYDGYITGNVEKEKKMNEEKVVEIVVILDRSGSMSSIKKDAIGGFNEFLRQQKALPGKARMTLVQFDDQYEVTFKSVPLEEVRELTEQTFIPRGMTALSDAIGRTINIIGEGNSACCECCRPKTIVAILTDGQENSSRKFTTHQINDMISHKREYYNWEFIFLAANQDAFAVGGSYGISPSYTWAYTADSIGTRQAFSSMNISTSALRKEDDDYGNKVGKTGV